MEVEKSADPDIPRAGSRSPEHLDVDDESGVTSVRQRRSRSSSRSLEEAQLHRNSPPPLESLRHGRFNVRRQQSEITDNEVYIYFLTRVDDEDHIHIVSPLVVAIIKDVVKFYPAAIFRRGSVELVSPFSLLYHYFDEMKARVSAESSSPELVEHFGFIERFVAKNLSERFQEIRESLMTDNSVSFEDLWALYKPGDYVVIKDGLHQKLVLMFTDIEEKKVRQPYINRPFPSYIVMAWCVVWNPSEKLFQRRSWKLKIPRYPGKRHVVSLPVYPLHAVSKAEQESLLAHLKDRGERWRSLVSGPALCFMHTGPAFKKIARDEDMRRDRYRQDGEQTTNLVGRVIVEEQKLSAYSRTAYFIFFYQRAIRHILGVLDLAMMSTAVKQNSSAHAVAGLDDRPEFKDWDDVAPDTVFSDEQKLLCPPTIACFDITTSKWYVVAVDNLRPVTWNTTAMNHLVLAESRKTLLRAVIEQHTKKEVGDIIQNKGIGLVILLHGPSGVGKTLTAESVAESTKRPLIPLSIQALISDGKRFESDLGLLFSNARRWNAILLLDEADIVLEARSFEDIHRNGIVSVFLRQLEYYGGILFLTTNRISTMDDAFQSRIQIAFDYKPLDRTIRRQIWSNLIASDAIEIADDARDSIDEALDDLSRLDLNGRQIRNTLNLAESLANDDFATPGQLQRDHITKAADATLKFKKMFNEAKKTAKGNARTVWAPYSSAGEPPAQVTQRVSSWDLS
ncbi:hypothetical protein MMC26_004403 [Xylographa opegraphella]|nr:hypothetical protein [Xylographa opegraphella]